MWSSILLYNHNGPDFFSLKGQNNGPTFVRAHQANHMLLVSSKIKDVPDVLLQYSFSLTAINQMHICITGKCS